MRILNRFGLVSLILERDSGSYCPAKKSPPRRMIYLVSLRRLPGMGIAMPRREQ